MLLAGQIILFANEECSSTKEVNMPGSFSTAALNGQVFFLEGRFQPGKKEKVTELIRDNGGTLATKFGPDVTVVLQEKPGKSKHPVELNRSLQDLTNLLGLRECDPAAVFADEDARRRLDRLPWFAFGGGFVFEVRDAAWSGETFRADADADSNVPWRLVNSTFQNCQFEHLRVVGSILGPNGRTAIDGGRATDCVVRNCRFAAIERWSAKGVTLEDSKANCLSECEFAEVRWLRGSLPAIRNSTVRSLFVDDGAFPSIAASAFRNCRFERLGNDEWLAVDDNLLRKVVEGGSLTDCLLVEVRLDQFHWEQVTLSGVKFENCKFKELVFTDCDLTGCRFENVSVGTLDFKNCRLSGCHWEGLAPETLGLPVDVSGGIAGLAEASDSGSSDGGSTVINIEAMPALAAFCEMFVARDNVKFDFVASTASGQPVDVHISKLRYWEFSAKGESVAFKTELGDLDDKSPAGVARVLARLFREVGITSVATKGMKVKMEVQFLNKPKVPAADFKNLARAAFEELMGAG